MSGHQGGRGTYLHTNSLHKLGGGGRAGGGEAEGVSLWVWWRGDEGECAWAWGCVRASAPGYGGA